MTTFYIYTEETSQYLGELLAIDHDAASTLAAAIWTVPLKITTSPLRKVA